jgi:hypothetical protein
MPAAQPVTLNTSQTANAAIASVAASTTASNAPSSSK